jgi:serine/threonine protein kinase
MQDVVVRFVKKILRKNPEQRQTIEQILKDPLLKISQTTTPLFWSYLLFFSFFYSLTYFFQ